MAEIYRGKLDNKNILFNGKISNIRKYIICCYWEWNRGGFVVLLFLKDLIGFLVNHYAFANIFEYILKILAFWKLALHIFLTALGSWGILCYEYAIVIIFIIQ
jgi:hypothetical protein